MKMIPSNRKKLNMSKNIDPLDIQIGGNHYKTQAIQPVEYIHANNLGFLEGCIVKRITRWREKNGLEDLLKIKHEVDLLIQLEKLEEPSLPVVKPFTSKPSIDAERFLKDIGSSTSN